MGTDHPPRDKQAYSLNRRFGCRTYRRLSRYLRMPFERMNLHLRVTNTPKTFTRSLRRMPYFAGFVQYRTSSAKTSFTQDNAQYHGRTVARVGGRVRSALAAARIYTNPVWAAEETRNS